MCFSLASERVNNLELFVLFLGVISVVKKVIMGNKS